MRTAGTVSKSLPFSGKRNRGCLIMKKALLTLVLFIMLLIPAGVSAAGISLLSPQDNQTLHEGEEILCKVQLSSAVNAYKVKIYVDGSFAKELSAKDELSCSIIGIGSGMHTVLAEAADVMGNVLSEASAIINIEAENPPRISVALLDESAEPVIDISEQDFAEVSVSDPENNYSHADVVLNGESMGTYSESSFFVDLSQSAAGDNIIKITAYDAYGNKSVYEKVFSVKRKINTVLTENNFENYSGSTPAGFLNFVTNKGGSYKAVTTDDAARGTSMAICVEQQAVQNDVDPNIHFELPDKLIKYAVEAAYLIPGDENGDYNATTTLRCRNSNGSELKILEFSKDGKIHILGSGGKLNAAAADGTIPYNLNEWYDVRVIVDGNSKKYDFYLNGELLAENRDAAGKGGEGITAFRFAICNNTQHAAEHACSEIGAKVYIDDIKISSMVDFPAVEKVTSSSGGSIIGGESDICVKLTEPVAESELGGKLSVESELGELPVSSAEFNPDDLTLNVTVGGVFQPNVRYRFKMSKGTKISSTVKTDKDLYYVFNAEKGAVDVVKSGFAFNGGRLEFEADIESTASGTTDMLMIIYIWEKDRLVFANSKSISVDSVKTITERISSKPLVKGETAEVFILKTPELDKPVSVKRFNFSM